DERKHKAFCTCGSRDVLGVVMSVEGLEFDTAKVRAAELLKRPDLIREQRTGKRKGAGVPPLQQRNGATPVWVPAGRRCVRKAVVDRFPSIAWSERLHLSRCARCEGPLLRRRRHRGCGALPHRAR